MSAAQCFAEHECAPIAVRAFEVPQGAQRAPWNVIGTVFGRREPAGDRMLLLSTEPRPPVWAEPIWLTAKRARRMRNDLLRAMRADDGGAVWLLVAGITFTVSEAEAIERVLDGCLELMEAGHG